MTEGKKKLLWRRHGAADVRTYLRTARAEEQSPAGAESGRRRVRQATCTLSRHRIATVTYLAAVVHFLRVATLHPRIRGATLCCVCVCIETLFNNKNKRIQ